MTDKLRYLNKLINFYYKMLKTRSVKGIKFILNDSDFKKIYVI